MIAEDLSLRATIAIDRPRRHRPGRGWPSGAAAQPADRGLRAHAGPDARCGPAGYLRRSPHDDHRCQRMLPASLLGIAAGAAYGLSLDSACPVGTMAGAIVASRLQPFAVPRRRRAAACASVVLATVSTVCLRAAARASFASCAFHQSCLSPRSKLPLLVLVWSRGPRPI